MSRQILSKPNSSSLLVEGDVHKRTTLANTLEILAKNGSDIFYNGTLGQQVINDLQKMGSNMTMDDLNKYR